MAIITPPALNSQQELRLCHYRRGMNHSQKVYTVVGATSIVAISAIVGYALFATPDKNTSAASLPSSSQTRIASSSTTPVATTTTSSSAGYKDGVYTASINYQVPEGGVNGLSVKLTVSGGKITAVSPDNSYEEHESARYINRFNNTISGTVVGQPLDGLYVGRVGGASLTSSAFNDALDEIRSQAQS